jgi:phosphoribosyl 1,2-cyclic phosphate phosphodiesterase
VWIRWKKKSFLIDTSPDLRQQSLRESIPRVDFVLYTHPHADHLGGIDDLRNFNFIQKKKIPIYAHDWTERELRSRFPYLFNKQAPAAGGGIAQLDLLPFDLDGRTFTVQGLPIEPIPVQHGRNRVAGFRLGKVAYITDCNHIPEASVGKLQNLSLLVLDCLRYQSHDTHLTFEQALHYAHLIKAQKTVFTHLSHDFDYKKTTRLLPKNVSLAYDGLNLTIR